METPFAFVNLKTINNQSILLSISWPWNTILALLLVGSLLWGSLMKALVYILYKKLRKMKRPMNLLILVDQVTNHSLNIYVGLNLFIELYFGLSPTEFAKTFFDIEIEATAYCRIFYFLSTFMFVHLVIGNSILAIHRTIYLKRTNFVKIFIGEELMMFISLVGGFFATTIMTYLFVNEKSSRRAVYNMCVGHSQLFEVTSF